MSGDAATAEVLPRVLAPAAVDHLAHDLRGSIHVIRGHAQLLQTEAAGIEARESANSIFDAGVRLGGLCEDVIDFLRLPAVAPGETVALALDDLGDVLTRLADDRGVQLRIVHPEPGGANLLVHSTVRRVVSHVLEHGARTAATNVTIAVSVPTARECVIAVWPAPTGAGRGEDGIIAVAAELLAFYGGDLSVFDGRVELRFPVVA
jgi:signal transduction histidine kinase